MIFFSNPYIVFLVFFIPFIILVILAYYKKAKIKTFYLFLDESGHTKEIKIENFNNRYFALFGIIISGDELEKLNERFNNLKKKIWGTDKIVLHRSGNNKFLKNKLNETINIKRLSSNQVGEFLSELKEIKFRCLLHMVDRKENIQSKNQDSIYHYCYEKSYICFNKFLLEQKEKNIEGKIYLERRRTDENNLMKKVHETLSNGNFSFNKKLDNSLINKKLFLEGKKDNINGLHVADFFAKDILIYWAITNHKLPSLDLNLKIKKDKYKHDEIVEFCEERRFAFTKVYKKNLSKQQW